MVSVPSFEVVERGCAAALRATAAATKALVKSILYERNMSFVEEIAIRHVRE